MLIVLLEYIALLQSEWQHETNIWEGLPCHLPFSIAVFHFKHSYCNLLSIFCSNLSYNANILLFVLSSYYSNYYAGKIDASLVTTYGLASIKVSVPDASMYTPQHQDGIKMYTIISYICD